MRLAKGIAFLLAVIGLFPIQARIDARKPEMPSSLLYTPDRRLMKVIACGHGPFLADLVWIQSISYVIREFQSGGNHIEHLFALFDVITELDPQFVDAYVMGAVFLSAVGNEPERAIELLEKGEGRIEAVGGEMKEVTEGRVHPEHKQRWRLLDETAAVHLVTYAGYAPTMEERYEEIRAAGKLYLYGASRYPVGEFPDRPKWYEDMGNELAHRELGKKFQDFSRDQYYKIVSDIWEARVLVTPSTSPLRKLYQSRYAEIQTRKLYEKILSKIDEWKKKHAGVPPARFEDFMAKAPEDPLGVGFFLVEGRLVAPALDAAMIERQLARDANAYRRANDRWPATSEALVAINHRTVPVWVGVTYDEKTGAVHVEPRPALVQPHGPR